MSSSVAPKSSAYVAPHKRSTAPSSASKPGFDWLKLPSPSNRALSAIASSFLDTKPPHTADLTGTSWRSGAKRSLSPPSPTSSKRVKISSRSPSPTKRSDAENWFGRAPQKTRADHFSNEEQYGLICRLPLSASEVPAEDEIHKHPDFENRESAWNHPVIIVASGYQNGKVCCAQVTAFTSRGGILEKYNGEGKAPYRKRWLLIDQPGGYDNHDKLPLLHFKYGMQLPKSSYVNTDHFFFIDPKHLDTMGREPIHLEEESVRTVLAHHDNHYSMMEVGVPNKWGINLHPKSI